ncbi:MAG: hypothetical protein KDA79_12900 [Planctomycetaceae bacterium]|nr:hypothetical protein [Planctomycetaceae bacterium]
MEVPDALPVPPAAALPEDAAAAGEEPEKAEKEEAEQAAPAKKEDDSTRQQRRLANKTLKSAREKLLACRSIQTSLRETVSLGGRRFRAEGSYIQGADLKLRLDFSIQIGSTEGSLLEVCDGGVLWTRHQAGVQSRITRRDVRQILRAADGRVEQNVLVAELGLGGLPALLAALDDSMVFNSWRKEEIDGRPFTLIEGAWKDSILSRFKGGKEDRPLPEHIPDSVRIWFDEATLFPRRIMYLKSPAGEDWSRPMVTLDFLDVVLNAPVNDDEFYFVPPDGVVPRDVTNEYLQRLKQVAQPAGEAASPAAPATSAPAGTSEKPAP